MTHHDDRHQLIPHQARAPREDDQATRRPMEGDPSEPLCWNPGRAAGLAVPTAAGGMRSDVRQDVGARETRYAEAMHASTCDVTRKPPCPVDGNLAWSHWAEAAVAVADAEQADLREQLRDALVRLDEQTRMTDAADAAAERRLDQSIKWTDRAEAAEAALTDLRRVVGNVLRYLPLDIRASVRQVLPEDEEVQP